MMISSFQSTSSLSATATRKTRWKTISNWWVTNSSRTSSWTTSSADSVPILLRLNHRRCAMPLEMISIRICHILLTSSMTWSTTSRRPHPNCSPSPPERPQTKPRPPQAKTRFPKAVQARTTKRNDSPRSVMAPVPRSPINSVRTTTYQRYLKPSSFLKRLSSTRTTTAIFTTSGKNSSLKTPTKVNHPRGRAM